MPQLYILGSIRMVLSYLLLTLWVPSEGGNFDTLYLPGQWILTFTIFALRIGHSLL